MDKCVIKNLDANGVMDYKAIILYVNLMFY